MRDRLNNNYRALYLLQMQNSNVSKACPAEIGHLRLVKLLQ